MKVSASTTPEVYSANNVQQIQPSAWEDGVNLLSSTAGIIPLISSE